MEIVLGITTDEKNKVNKSFSSTQSVSGNLKEESSVLNPTFTIFHANPSSLNYCYVPAFHRYYYITDMTALNNNRWLLSLRVDPLKSFASYIMALSPLIERTSIKEKANEYINDGTLGTDTRIQHIVKTFTSSNGWNPSAGKFVLYTAGSGEASGGGEAEGGGSGE